MMTGLVRKATLLSVCGLLGASAVMAGVPNLTNSSIGTGIILVGTAGAGAATVKADGVSLGSLTVAIADENGAQCCNTVDLALMLNDNFSDVPATAANERGRSDFNADGKVNVVDVALFLNIKNANGST